MLNVQMERRVVLSSSGVGFNTGNYLCLLSRMKAQENLKMGKPPGLEDVIEILQWNLSMYNINLHT